ncbi:MAG: SUMF1/EgtB/PvdO family nonheme iron enzyme, partial [Myxococcota bacterium]|nr:SUMF1/EgtB/PvdO family nonheme iron enzyme [Myxococcota bacterium]
KEYRCHDEDAEGWHVCGDGVQQEAEACDDGNRLTERCRFDDEGCEICNEACERVVGALSLCGNGALDEADGEACDGSLACDESCQFHSTVSTVRGVTFHEQEIPAMDGQEPFLMMRTEVTQELYQAIMYRNPSHFEGESRPVENVNWEDGIRFANALSSAMGLEPAYDGDDNDAVLIEDANGFRYPFSIDWYRAATCGDEYEYAGGDILDVVAWYEENSAGETHPVASKRANSCGLYDMMGNVSEWTADDYDRPYRSYHVPGARRMRGYGGCNWGQPAILCRLSEYAVVSGGYVAIHGEGWGRRSSHYGLRLVRPLE